MLQEDTVRAYDPKTGELQKSIEAPKGFTLRYVAARPGQVAVLALQYGKAFLLISDY